jgi:hypothetical protein
VTVGLGVAPGGLDVTAGAVGEGLADRVAEWRGAAVLVGRAVGEAGVRVAGVRVAGGAGAAEWVAARAAEWVGARAVPTCAGVSGRTRK